MKDNRDERTISERGAIIIKRDERMINERGAIISKDKNLNN